MRDTPVIEIPIELDRASTRPLSVQLSENIRELIDAEILRAGTPLPSTRSWARTLSVSRGTVVTAYEQLTGEGYLDATTGSHTQVNPRLADIHPPRTPALAPRAGSSETRTTRLPSPALAPAIDLTAERPSPRTLATARWRGAWQRAAAQTPGRLPAEGLPELRHAIAEHMQSMRGLARPAEHYLVTAGAREGLALLRTVIGRDGVAPRVGVEQPGYPSLRRALRRLGCDTIGLPVDAHGIRIEGILPLDAIVVTPSHQYPVGGSLPRDRRLALIAWARSTGTLIIEDDYDSELRYAGHPLPALSALDDPADGCVVTLGTFSKTLAAEVATGFMIVPERLLGALSIARNDLGQPVAAVTQAAVADYLRSGELRRHTARMRRVYRRRRDIIIEALSDIADIDVRPMDGGVHCVIETRVPEAQVIATTARHGIRVTPLSTYWSADEAVEASVTLPRMTGVVVGCAHFDERTFAAAIERLAVALREATVRGDDADWS